MQNGYIIGKLSATGRNHLWEDDPRGHKSLCGMVSQKLLLPFPGFGEGLIPVCYRCQNKLSQEEKQKAAAGV